MSAKLGTIGRETLIVKIAIDRPWQPPSPSLCSLSRTVSSKSSLIKNVTDFMFKEPHMHFFILQNRGQIGPQSD
jgi:hypothetical protein